MAVFHFPDRDNSGEQKLGSAAGRFNNTDDYVSIPDDPSLRFGDGATDSPFSIAAWIKINSLGSGAIVAKFEDGGEKEWTFQLNASTELEFFVQDDSAASGRGRKHTTTLSVDIEYHAVVTYDGGGLNSSTKLYLNGSQVDDADSGFGGAYTAIEGSASPVKIGMLRASDSSAPFNGLIDEVEIFDRVLSGPEITALYNEQNAGTEMDSNNALWDANLISVFHMNKTWLDSKGSNDGTRSGSGAEFAAQLTIEPFESYPSSRPEEEMQSRDRTPAGTPIVYDLGPTLQFISLRITLLSASDKTSLESFIKETIEWAANTFDFDDDQGTEYNTCRFWLDDLDFSQRFLDRFDEDLLLAVDPT